MAHWRRTHSLVILAATLGMAISACKAGCSALNDDAEPRTGSTALQLSEAKPSSLVAWKAPIQVATGDAERGPWRMNESRFHYVDDATVAMGPDDRIVVAWVDNREKDVFFRSYDQSGTSLLPEAVNVSRTPAVFSWLPRVVLGASGEEIFVLWQEIVFSGGTHGGEIFFARSSDGGRHFDPPLNLSNTIAGAGKGRLTKDRWDNGSLDLARSPDGTLLAAWTEYEGALRVSRSTDGGRSFSPPVQVSASQDPPARGPSLGVRANGVYLAWTVGEDPAADIRVSHSTDGGRSFGAPQVALPSDGHSDAPSLGVDSDGTVHLVYAESPSGLGKQYHVRYASRPEDATAFGSSRRISGSVPGEQGAAFPSLEIGGDDRLYVVWEHYPDFRDRPRGLGFTASKNGGRTFMPPARIPGTTAADLGFNGSLQGLLSDKLTANAAGTLAAADSHFDPHERSLVRLIVGRLPP